jgi:hypothetical protein
VEVRVDDGPWQRATLATAINANTWRLWKADVETPQGRHIFQVRATDADGSIQTGKLAPPPPNGATGYHTVNLYV